MAFTSKPSGNASESTIDFAAMNAEIVATCDVKEPTALVGVVSGVIDLGLQQQPDSEVEFDGDAAEEAKQLAEDQAREGGGGLYFKTEMVWDNNKKARVEKRLKCWPNKPRQSVAITVDFPQIEVDKGKWFGDSNPAPLRMVLNGEFKGEVARLFPIVWEVIGKDDSGKNIFSIKQNTTLYKLAKAVKLIGEGEPLLPEQLPQLVGKAAMFEIVVKLNDGFLQEKIKLASSLPRGMSAPELDEKYQYLIEFGSEQGNDPEQLKQLRKSIKTTIKKANNYVGDKIQGELEAVEGSKTSNQEGSVGDTENVASTSVQGVTEGNKKGGKAKTKPAPVEDFDDEDDPF